MSWWQSARRIGRTEPKQQLGWPTTQHRGRGGRRLSAKPGRSAEVPLSRSSRMQLDPPAVGVGAGVAEALIPNQAEPI